MIWMLITSKLKVRLQTETSAFEEAERFAELIMNAGGGEFIALYAERLQESLLSES